MRSSLDLERWSALRAFWLLAAQRGVRGEDDMAQLSDFVRQEDLEGFWIFRKGREEGREEGRQETLYSLLSSFLSDRFGPLPSWADSRLRQVDSPQEAQDIIRRLGDARSIADALGEPPAS